MKAMIIDRDATARQALKILLSRVDDVQVIGEYGHAFQAIHAIHRLHPDIVFLDVRTPRFHVMETLSVRDPKHLPHIIFTTAYDASMINELKTHAFDYLLKPMSATALSKILVRLRHRSSLCSAELWTEKLRHIPCSGGNLIYLVRIEEVEFACSRMDGVYVNDSDGKERPTELTLKVLENKTSLFRCHRQFLVNLDRIRSIRLLQNGLAEIEVLSDKAIPVSRRYLQTLKEQFSL